MTYHQQTTAFLLSGPRDRVALAYIAILNAAKPKHVHSEMLGESATIAVRLVTVADKSQTSLFLSAVKAQPKAFAGVVRTSLDPLAGKLTDTPHTAIASIGLTCRMRTDRPNIASLPQKHDAAELIPKDDGRHPIYRGCVRVNIEHDPLGAGVRITSPAKPGFSAYAQGDDAADWIEQIEDDTNGLAGYMGDDILDAMDSDTAGSRVDTPA